MISIDGDFIILSSLENGVFVDKRLGCFIERTAFWTAGLHRFNILNHIDFFVFFSGSVCVCVCRISFSSLQTIFLFKSHFMYENRLNGLNKNAILSGWIWNFLGLTSIRFFFSFCFFPFLAGYVCVCVAVPSMSFGATNNTQHHYHCLRCIFPRGNWTGMNIFFVWILFFGGKQVNGCSLGSLALALSIPHITSKVTSQ